jgi:hypothetical protein
MFSLSTTGGEGAIPQARSTKHEARTKFKTKNSKNSKHHTPARVSRAFVETFAHSNFEFVSDF